MAVDALTFDPGKVSLMADPLPALKRLSALNCNAL